MQQRMCGWKSVYKWLKVESSRLHNMWQGQCKYWYREHQGSRVGSITLWKDLPSMVSFGRRIQWFEWISAHTVPKILPRRCPLCGRSLDTSVSILCLFRVHGGADGRDFKIHSFPFETCESFVTCFHLENIKFYIMYSGCEFFSVAFLILLQYPVVFITVHFRAVFT